MISRPFSLRRHQKSISTLSPRRISKPQQQNNRLSKQKISKKCQYMRPKPSYIKSLASGRSLRSLDINHVNSSHSNNKRILSHRKLISLSSIQNKNLTQRRQATNQYQGSSKNVRLNNIHSNRFIKYNKDNQEDNLNNINSIHHIDNMDNMDRALEIKENILKEFIDKFQEQLKHINQQKSSRKTLVTHRMKAQTETTHRLRTQTAKKQALIRQCSQSNNQTINHKQQKSKFQKYLKELQQNKCKDKKILVIKNPKKTLYANQNTQQVKPQQTKLANRQINLKQLFKHSSKYQPFIKDKQNTLSIKLCTANQAKQTVDQRKQAPVNKKKQDRPFDVEELMSPINKAKQNSHYRDVQCSTIERINQSSFISQMGRNSLLQNLDTDRLKGLDTDRLKNLDTDRLKILKDQNKMSKKCLAKMKNLFPTDFFL